MKLEYIYKSSKKWFMFYVNCTFAWFGITFATRNGITNSECESFFQMPFYCLPTLYVHVFIFFISSVLGSACASTTGCSEHSGSVCDSSVCKLGNTILFLFVWHCIFHPLTKSQFSVNEANNMSPTKIKIFQRCAGGIRSIILDVLVVKIFNVDTQCVFHNHWKNFFIISYCF